jgi:hypothetical protein
VEGFDSWEFIQRLLRNFHKFGRWNLPYSGPKMRNARNCSFFWKTFLCFSMANVGGGKARVDSKLLGPVIPQRTLTYERHCLVSNTVVLW